MSVRVVIVDDSAICRAALADVLEAEGDIRVVGEAADGPSALQRIARLRPDLATVDVRMPGMDGLELISRVMAGTPVPLLVVTGLPRASEGSLLFEATRRGALDLAAKPSGRRSDEGAALRRRVRRLAVVPVVRRPLSQSLRAQGVEAALPAADRTPLPEPARRPAVRAPTLGPAARPAAAPTTGWKGRAPRVVGLGASAGGPPAVARLLGALPGGVPCAVALVQHLPVGFARSYAEFLRSRTSLTVRIADGPLRPEPGVVVIPPDDRHLIALPDGRLGPSDAPAAEGYRPSVSVLLDSLAEVYGDEAAGVILSGIGSDGTRGLLHLRSRGGLCIAQDRASSAVYGMPRAAAESGAAEQILDVGAIAPALLAALNGFRREAR